MTNPVRIFRIPGAPTPGSGLPKIPSFGFSDNFERPDSTVLGTAPSGQTWELYYPSGTPQFGITAGAARYNPSASTPDRGIAVLDAHSGDGRFKAVLGPNATPGSGSYSGMAFRISPDKRNGLFLTNNASSALRICELAPGPSGIGTVIVAEVAAKKLDANAVIEIVLNGPSVTVLLNTVQVLTYTDNTYKANTRHGLFGYEADKATFRWASVDFIV